MPAFEHLTQPYSREDMQLIQQAARRGWPVEPEGKAEIVAGLQRLIADKNQPQSIRDSAQKTALAVQAAGWTEAPTVKQSA